jgi:hypothetical protein
LWVGADGDIAPVGTSFDAVSGIAYPAEANQAIMFYDVNLNDYVPVYVPIDSFKNIGAIDLYSDQAVKALTWRINEDGGIPTVLARYNGDTTWRINEDGGIPELDSAEPESIAEPMVLAGLMDEDFADLNSVYDADLTWKVNSSGYILDQLVDQTETTSADLTWQVNNSGYILSQLVDQTETTSADLTWQVSENGGVPAYEAAEPESISETPVLAGLAFDAFADHTELTTDFNDDGYIPASQDLVRYDCLVLVDNHGKLLDVNTALGAYPNTELSFMTTGLFISLNPVPNPDSPELISTLTYQASENVSDVSTCLVHAKFYAEKVWILAFYANSTDNMPVNDSYSFRDLIVRGNYIRSFTTTPATYPVLPCTRNDSGFKNVSDSWQYFMIFQSQKPNDSQRRRGLLLFMVTM